MDPESQSSPLTAFNAIKLSPRQVAETFISSPAFESLLRADNAILSGPRGSGKTTLLKMLQSEALEHWDDPEAGRARRSVRAVGVFIGTDRTWNEQLATPGTHMSEEDREVIAWAAFASHTFKSVVAAMNYRVRGREGGAPALHLGVGMGDEAERSLVEHLSGLLDFESQPASLDVLSRMLSGRLADLGRVRRQLRRGRPQDLPAWVDLDVLTIVDAAVEAFNDFADQPDQTWALLFDELELAPPALVEELLGALRGHQPRLVYKLSIAPANDMLNTLEGLNAPVPGMDYEYIPLTHARKVATRAFAKELVRRTLERQGLKQVPPINLLLGDGDLDSTDDPLDPDDPFFSSGDKRSTPYATGAYVWERMHQLALRDTSFAKYLISNGVDLKNLGKLTANQRASRLRKVRNIVIVREYYRNDAGRRRSRKSFALYSGADNILSLPDGNPRMLIALTRALSARVQGAGSRARVPKPAQGVAIEATLARFLPLLEAQEAVRVGERLVTLMQMLDHVGAALAKRLVEDDFNQNVRLTFVVDDDIVDAGLELIRRGVNTGALVYVPPRDSDGRLKGSLRGKTFRLSHLLATRYGLPIHLTKESPLSQLVPSYLTERKPPRGRGSRRRSSAPGQAKLDLGLEKEDADE